MGTNEKNLLARPLVVLIVSIPVVIPCGERIYLGEGAWLGPPSWSSVVSVFMVAWWWAIYRVAFRQLASAERKRHSAP